MSFDRTELAAAITAHGRVARVVVAAVQGSAPRETGASMLVWQHANGFGQSGTIGGGTLEYEAAQNAFHAPRLQRLPLGPSMGQCCGGTVTLLTEVFESVTDIPEDVFARGPATEPSTMPLAIKRLLKDARSQGTISARLVGDWMIEAVSPPTRPLWIWGAGHVGRALVGTLSPLPHFAITWIDTAANRFPHSIPEGVTQLVAAAPADLMRYAPQNGEHLILTYSHALDLDLCHALLGHSFDFCGLIGSKTKWARFRSRLHNLGHSDAQIARICCPIGQPELGKHPQAIAVGVAARLISGKRVASSQSVFTGGQTR